MADAPDLAPKERRALRFARVGAARMLRNRFRVLALTRDVYRKLKGNEGSLRDAVGTTVVLTRLVRAWARREYRGVPWKSLTYAVGALLYFVNPLDVIPDALAGLGFVDDIAVLAAVAKSVQGDLEKFEAWEAERGVERANLLPPPKKRRLLGFGRRAK
jgi:uncharacterized membrane protein YkvA (DUF1232 family)